jgi:lysyl-tRNA synthetase, class I
MKTSWIEDKCSEIERTAEPPYICASGISVSGVLHPGKLRDIFIANQVYSRLKERGNEVKLIYFIDDFDRFKKAPKEFSDYKQFIGLPYSEIPSPSKESGSSFVNYFFNEFYEGMKTLNINPDMIFESQRYLRGEYNSEIETIFNNINLINDIFRKIRKKEINPANLFHVYCEKCNKDNPLHKKLNSNKTLDYLCSCGYESNISIFKPGNIKLSWIANWPSRWNKEGTSFEPIGPDHAAPQGCFEVSSEIYRKIFNKSPPIVQTYGFINLKGGRKLSSSGTKTSLKNMMEIYDPHVIEWIFSSKNPETFFNIDLENPFEIYNRADEEKNIHLPSFKEIVLTLNANLGKYPPSKQRNNSKLEERIERAKNWITQHSPTDFKFNLLERASNTKISDSEIEFRKKLINLLQIYSNETDIENGIYSLMKEIGFDRKKEFSNIYIDLFGKPQGPRLAKVLLESDPKKLKKLLLK